MLDLEITAEPDAEFDAFMAAIQPKDRQLDRHKTKRKGDRHKTKRKGDRHKSRLPDHRPFIIVDGEGGGRDPVGRQNYLLIGAAGINGDYSQLFNDNRPLSTQECLKFILQLPSTEDAIVCSFYFNYDVTMILKDVKDERVQRLFAEKDDGCSRYTHLSEFGCLIEYVSGKFFRVAKADPKTGKPVKRSARTIYDAGRMFQMPFVEILEQWGVADADTLDLIRKLKEDRENFTQITSAIIKYNELECRKFAEVMTLLREVCLDKPNNVIDFKPAKWNGSGDIATRMLTSAGVIKRKHLPARPPEFDEAVRRAYFGGRAELSRTGFLPLKIYDYDINSSYANDITQLPCPMHTTWRRLTATELDQLQSDLKRGSASGRFLCKTTFEHPEDTIWGALPFRTKDGHIHWPLKGTGTYWSPELIAAAKHGVKLQLLDGWIASTSCDCKPFDWVQPLYDYRLSVDAARGYPIKLGLASINGKFAQRVGEAPWHDLVASGLITSMTRAKVYTAAMTAPMSVVMIATDGLCSTEPLPSLPLSTKLGDWKLKILPDLLIVQSGFYWSPSAVEETFKTRGIRRSLVAKHADAFTALWREFILDANNEDRIPANPVLIKVFIGLQLWLALIERSKQSQSQTPIPPRGSWQYQPWHISFDWKRFRERGHRLNTFVFHFPITGTIKEVSEPYNPDLLTQLSQQQLLLGAMPDYINAVE